METVAVLSSTVLLRLLVWEARHRLGMRFAGLTRIIAASRLESEVL
jgi:hypothetical protein